MPLYSKKTKTKPYQRNKKVRGLHLLKAPYSIRFYYIYSLFPNDQREARGVVVHRGFKFVARVGKQVDVLTRQIVDEVKVLHLDMLGINAEGVGAIRLRLEVERHLAFSPTTHHG